MGKKLYFTFFFGFVLLSVSSVFAQSDNLNIKPYGFFKLDMAYDDARTNNGNYVFWVNNNPDNSNTSEFNMTARQTRLGANLSYDGLRDKKVTARFELDFYGGGDENKNIPMLRHAFLKVDFGKYYLLAGQTSDVISPLVPTTVNYTVLWNCGNIGYRCPQIQFGNTFSNGFEIVGALSRNIPGDLDNDQNDVGEDSSLPAIQARFLYKNSKMNIGVSGHYGKMEYTNSKEKDDNYSSYSFNAHASYTFSRMLSLKGELFTGKTLNQYLGGIGQGFDINLEKEIESSGGWINAGLNVHKNTSFNLGFGIDQPDVDDFIKFPEKNGNMCIFGNVFTKIAHNTTLAVEVSHWSTGYYGENGKDIDKTNLRVQTSFIMNL